MAWTSKGGCAPGARCGADPVAAARRDRESRSAGSLLGAAGPRAVGVAVLAAGQQLAQIARARQAEGLRRRPGRRSPRGLPRLGGVGGARAALAEEVVRRAWRRGRRRPRHRQGCGVGLGHAQGDRRPRAHRQPGRPSPHGPARRWALWRKARGAAAPRGSVCRRGRRPAGRPGDPAGQPSSWRQRRLRPGRGRRRQARRACGWLGGCAASLAGQQMKELVGQQRQRGDVRKSLSGAVQVPSPRRHL